MQMRAVDAFTQQYIRTALWSTNDQSDENTGGEPLDKNYTSNDIEEATLAAMLRDCKVFKEENAADIIVNASRAGHDFWLTRNGHGAGFWDGDWPENVGERLTKAAEAFGTFDLCLGDNKRIYGSPLEARPRHANPS